MPKSQKSPLYLQIYKKLKNDIVGGIYPTKTFLPAERTLSTEFSVERVTIRHALNLLAQEKYIFKKQGAGSKVIYGAEMQSKQENIQVSKPVVFILSADFGEKIKQPFVSDIFYEFERQCKKNNQDLIYTKLHENEPIPSFLLCENQITGAIFISNVAKKFIDSAIKNHIPSILISNEYNDLFSIKPDNLNGAFLATEYLIQKGCRKIAFIGGDKNFFNSSQRLTGYKRALATYGIYIDDSLVMENGTWDFDSGFTCMNNLIASPKKFDAVFAANDMMALGAIRALITHKISVPSDVKVIGFDNIDHGKYANPSLTTVNVSAKMFASLSHLMLNKMITEGQMSGSVIVPATLVIGETT